MFCRFENIDDYPPTAPRNDYFYDDMYYGRSSTPYVPEVRPNVVFDYGHKKIDEELKLPDSKKSECIFFLFFCIKFCVVLNFFTKKI